MMHKGKMSSDMMDEKKGKGKPDSKGKAPAKKGGYGKKK